MLDTHVTQLHNCAERHHKLQQVMKLLECAHQQGVAVSTPEVAINLYLAASDYLTISHVHGFHPYNI